MACGDNEEITVVDFRWAEWVCIAAILSRSCSLWVKKRTSEQVRVMSALPPKADIGSAGRDVRFVPKADIHGLFDHLDTPNGNQRSISPNTMSREPSIAGTSASMCPRVKKSIAAKCGNDGARILHLYGWLVPSETR